MATSCKKQRTDCSTENDKSMVYKDMTLYILHTKIFKQRLQAMKRSARQKGFPISDTFSNQITHIVSELDTRDAVLKNDLVKCHICDDKDDIEIVNTHWFAECMKAGKPVDVQPEHRLPGNQKKITEEVESCQESLDSEYVCQNSTPLKHQNERLTKPLEILQKLAEFRDSDQDYSRALAFRNGISVLKALPFPVTDINQINGKKHIRKGGHIYRVIQELLEDGYCQEAEETANSDWFKKMEIFTKVFGVGSSTAKKWISSGIETIDGAIAAEDLDRRDDYRVSLGLAFYEDLNFPVNLSEALTIKELVYKEVQKITPGITVELIGGFRRGKEQGHDIDLLISHPEERQEEGLLRQLLMRLEQLDLLLSGNHERSSYTEELLKGDTKLRELRGSLDHFEKWIGIMKVHKKFRERTSHESPDSHLCIESDKSDICQLHSSSSQVDPVSNSFKTEKPDSIEMAKPYKCTLKKAGSTLDANLAISRSARTWYARRVDLIVVPASQYFYALVGWTGSKHFNRSLRLYATRVLNMKLTSHGLYDFQHNKSIPVASEKEVFEILKVPYRDPKDRNC